MVGAGVIQLLEEALRIPSLTGQEHRMAEHLRSVMDRSGYDEAFIDAAGNAVGIIGAGPRQIVLMGHMDTVAGEVPVRYQDGCLYGRGAVDAKGPLCAFVLAAAHVQQAIRASGEWQVVVIGATEEEAAYSKGANHAAARYQPEMCIIGEPSGSGGITVGYKGRMLIEADFDRGSQHTAAPGPSVTEAALELWEHIRSHSRQFNEGKAKVFDQILPSLRRVASHDDGLKESCRLTIGLRLPLDWTPQDAEKLIRDWSQENALAHGVRHAIRYIGHESAYLSAKDSRLARAFVNSIRAEKLRPSFKLKTGTADFNVVGPIWRCPMVAYGPGDSSLDHTPNEHVPVEEFERGVRVLERVLAELVARAS